ncbi:MAG TPA: 6-phosphogluconolactonase [Solirubrobacteraceae bacterium]|jgi:6-phosphogluconolactonase
MTRLTTCSDAETVAERAAAHVIGSIERAVAERGVAHVALSGGTSPGRTFELLAREPDALGALEIWFADERCVAPDDEESNYLLARRTLLEPAAIANERVHRMMGELGPDEGAARYAAELGELGPDESAARYAAELGERVADDDGSGRDGPPVLDLVVLGIGPDGHVASLFPGAATLDAGEDAVCLGVRDSPKPPPERITLSLAVLQAARECLLIATGASKADAVSAMLGEPSRHVPASLLRRERLTVIADDAAAPDGPRF